MNEGAVAPRRPDGFCSSLCHRDCSISLIYQSSTAEIDRAHKRAFLARSCGPEGLAHDARYVRLFYRNVHESVLLNLATYRVFAVVAAVSHDFATRDGGDRVG